MPPNVKNTASLEAGLRSLVRYYLDCMLHSNAIFLCERLVACNPREENVLLLATCYFGESSELRAHALLQGCRLPESRFLLATCCLNLGRLVEVERVLLEGTGVLQKGPNESREEILSEPCPIPFGAAGLRLLGLACQAAGRRESAEEYFRLSLELDPLMWVSIQSLCELGADFDVEKHFERFLEKAAGAAARSSAGGPAPAAETRGKRLPWSSYLQASSGGRADENVVCGTAWWRGDDAAQAMPPPPPPPPGARSSAASVSAGTMETPTRSRGGETKNTSPDGGRALFGTPGPTQRRGGSGANATTSHGQAFMTPAFRTPAASGVRFNTAGGGATPGGGIGGGRSGRGMSSPAAAVSRGKSCRRKGGGAPRGAAATRPAASSAAASASSAAASDGIGHLLDLGARLGAFFPPAVGPGPVPGLEQLLQEASEAVSSAEEKEKERPAALTTTAAAAPATPSGDGIETPIGKAEASGVRRRGGGGRIFATPGLTPIPTAWTPDHAGARDDDDASSVKDDDTAAQEETPSMFLAGLLRGTPETAGGTARRGGGRGGGSAFFSETPVPLVEGRLPEPVGMRAARMSAAGAAVGGGGGGGLGSSALQGEMTAARAREAATGGREEAGAGASEGAGTASASVGVGVPGRGPRSTATGGRRIGGRLSFSSAMGTDDANSTGSVAGGGGGGSGGGGASVGEGGTEDRGRVPSRSQGRRRVATPGTTTPSASSHARNAVTPAARSSMRPPPPAGGSGATPTSAVLAGRASRLSTSNRGGGGAEATGGGRASRNAYPSITPMDVDEGAAERTPAAQNSRRPNTRAASKRTGNAAGGGTRQTPVGTGTVGRVPVGSRWAIGKNNDGGGMNSSVSAGVGGDRGPGGVAADGRKEKGGDAAVKMTREQWQRAQYEETMAFAAVVIRRVSALGGEKEGEKDKETERVVAALAVLKAAAQASEAARENTVVGAGAGAWAGDWAVARVFPHQEGGKREPGGGAGGGKGVIESGLRAVASLLVVLGKGYQHLMQFRCIEALEELKQLSPAQFCTGWVLHQVGKAYFERADYANAKSVLESMQRYDPHRLAGLDLLSTTLWHLKREVELSYLAQKVSEFDRLSPYTWCVVGNCFSLQKEHETALRFFQRAIQLDADMTYAYTLCGHEYVVNEDFDKAVACFRMAIRTDRRHYNAWYGLGSIYHRQEKYDMAEYHFRRALSINPQSSVLRVYLGMVLHANKRYVEALDMLGAASKTEPTNPQASFQRANVLMSMERYAEALRELEAVRNNVPKESAVYFLMGKVCKKLGKTDAAMRHFTIALDLHNKDKNLIKAAVDRLNEPDLDEEEKF